MAEVNQKHKQYAAREDQWRKIEDATEGEDALKAHDLKTGTDNQGRYIPVLPGHDRAAKTRAGKLVDEYADIYLRYAVYYGQPSIVLDGMLGLIFKQAPDWSGMDAIDSDLQNITLEGDDRDEFAAEVAAEVIKRQWGGVLTDWSTTESRAYQRLYDATALVNWRRVVLDGVPTWQQFVLYECVNEDDPDGFGTVDVEQFRVLELVDPRSLIADFTAMGEQPPESITSPERLDPRGNYSLGIYAQQVYRMLEVDGKEHWAKYGPPIVPDRNGSPLWFIPFKPLDEKPGTPPLLGITNMALAHYRNSADLENGIHKAGVPTLGLFGFRVDGSDIRPGSLVRADNSDARAEYVMTGGSGCAEVARAMTEKQKAIAGMASRMLSEDQPKGAETPEAHELRMVGSDARVRKLSQRTSAVLSASCAFHLWWATGRELPDCVNSAVVKLNTKFFERRMSPADLQTMWMVHLDGGMSRALYEEAKHSGGFARDGYSPDQERVEAEAEAAVRQPDIGPLFDDPATV